MLFIQLGVEMNQSLFPVCPLFPRKLLSIVLKDESLAQVARIRLVSRAWCKAIMDLGPFVNELKALRENRSQTGRLIIREPIRAEAMSILRGKMCRVLDINCGGFRRWNLNNYLDDLVAIRADEFAVITLHNLPDGLLATMDLDSVVSNNHSRLAKLEIDGCVDFHLEDFETLVVELKDRLVLRNCSNIHRRRNRRDAELSLLKMEEIDRGLRGLDFSPPLGLVAGQLPVSNISRFCWSLNFSRSQIDDGTVAKLAAQYKLKKLPSLRMVDFSHCELLTGGALRSFFPVIKSIATRADGFVSFHHCSNLTVLDLSDTPDLTDWLLDQVLKTFTFDLITSVRSTGPHSLRRGGRRLSEMVHKLDKFDWGNSTFVGPDSEPPAPIREPEPLVKDDAIAIDTSDPVWCHRPLMEVIKGSPAGIRSIVINDISTMTDEHMLQLCSKAENCEELILRGCRNVTALGWNQLMEWVSSKRPPIQRLELSAPGVVGGEMTHRIVEACTQLRTLSLTIGHQFPDHKVLAPLIHLRSITFQISRQLLWSPFSERTLDACFSPKQWSQLEELIIRGGLSASWALTAFENKCPRLRRATLEYVGLSDDALTRLVASAPGLETLEVPASGISDIGMQAVSQNCPGLRHLDLQRCSAVTDESMDALAAGCTGLESLSLAFCDGVSGEGIVRLIAALPKLRTLDLSNLSQLTPPQLVEIVGQLRGLDKLVLRGCDAVTNDVLLAIAERGELKSLDLVGCNRIDDDSLKALAAMAPGLDSLEIGGSEQLSSRGIAFFLGCSSQLRSLYLEGKKKVTHGVLGAIRACTPNLRSLSLLPLSPGLGRAVFGLSVHLPKIRELNLDRIDLSDSDVSDWELEAFAPFAARLARLNLARCQQLTPAGLQRLAESCPRLLELDLSELWSATEEIVATFAKHSPNLKRITLAGCSRVTDVAILALADHTAALSALDISDCYSIHPQSLYYMIQKLRVRSLNICNSVGVYFEECSQDLLVRAFRQCQLETLHIGVVDHSTTVELVDLFEQSRFTALRELHIPAYELRENALLRIAELNPHLERLEWAGAQVSLGPEEIARLAGFCPKLKHVQSNPGCMSLSLRAVADHMPHLETLDIEAEEEATGNDIIYLSQRCHSLRILRVNRVEPDTFDKVLLALGEGCPKLRELKVKKCGWCASEEEVHRMAYEYLPRLENLTLLDCWYDCTPSLPQAPPSGGIQSQFGGVAGSPLLWLPPGGTGQREDLEYLTGSLSK